MGGFTYRKWLKIALNKFLNDLLKTQIDLNVQIE